MKNFDWDSWSGKLRFNDLRSNFGYLPSIRELPTIYNEKDRLVYLTSLDLDFDSTSIGELKHALGSIVDSYRVKKQKYEDSAKTDLELAILRNDFNFICKLLDQAFLEQGEDDSELNCKLPDELFRSLVGES